ncbi:hypothetical protein NPIL_306551 [Nephila pilipes]|uniref:Uncharacterized protein n=1 Tax=Nephila pilipes TaxID=299642 RepID=A0A8X6PNX3_NEPPI|nr:hypothetical protein NPIL_306551 [Nephila pilipes]
MDCVIGIVTTVTDVDRHLFGRGGGPSVLIKGTALFTVRQMRGVTARVPFRDAEGHVIFSISHQKIWTLRFVTKFCFLCHTYKEVLGLSLTN